MLPEPFCSRPLVLDPSGNTIRVYRLGIRSPAGHVKWIEVDYSIMSPIVILGVVQATDSD